MNKKFIRTRDEDLDDFLNKFSDEAAMPDKEFKRRLKLRLFNRVTLWSQIFKNWYHLLQALISNVRSGFPARKLTIIGVTGTSGKSIVASMIYHVLKSCGYKIGIISSDIIKFNGDEISSGFNLTTPQPWELPTLLRSMIDAGMKYVVLEASSLGLDQNRLFGTQFDTTVITNIGSDHLAYHKSWGNYAKAKFKLIKKVKRGGLIVLNKNHKSARWLRKKIKKLITPREIRWVDKKQIEDQIISSKSIGFSYRGVKIDVPIEGEYNVSNILGTILACQKYEKRLDLIAKALSSYSSLKGRMEVIQHDPYTVIMDSAKQEESLIKLLKSTNRFKRSKSSRIILVFGCTGEKNVHRRSMGRAASKLADTIILSIQDPGGEPVRKINKEILQYIQLPRWKVQYKFQSHEDYSDNWRNIINKKNHEKSIFSLNYSEIQNRIDAIDLALHIAKEGDVVLVVGQGQRSVMGIGKPLTYYKYDELATIKTLLKRIPKI